MYILVSTYILSLVNVGLVYMCLVLTAWYFQPFMEFIPRETGSFSSWVGHIEISPTYVKRTTGFVIMHILFRTLK